MEVPATVAGLVIALFALLPGLPSEWVYRLMAGIDWREDRWQRTLRLLGFSTFGLALYASIAPAVGAPPPLYILPSTFAKLSVQDLPALSGAFLGHVLLSVVVAILSAVLGPRISHLVTRLSFVTAWDRFVNGRVDHRWVIVALQSGHIYAGYIEIADNSVVAAERDLVLREPAIYVDEEQIYRLLGYESLFLLGSTIASVAVAADPADVRLTVPGESLFLTPKDDRKRQNYESH